MSHFHDHFMPGRWRTPLLVCLAAIVGGAGFGIVTNAIDGLVSRDYFAIVMSWDWQPAPLLAILQGAIEGAVVGLFFGVLFTVVLAASTHMQCPLALAFRGLALALLIAVAGWIVGGIAGAVLAQIDPGLWGFFFIGVPPRVNLPRFAWVGGSIRGAYAGTAVGLVASSIHLHITWGRMTARVQGFTIIRPKDV